MNRGFLAPSFLGQQVFDQTGHQGGDQCGTDPEGGEEWPQQAVGQHPGIGPDLGSSHKETDAGAIGGAFALQGADDWNHAAGAQRNGNAEEGGLEHRKHSAAAQVLLDEILRKQQMQQPGHQQPQQQQGSDFQVEGQQGL